jgi:plastocyanin
MTLAAACAAAAVLCLVALTAHPVAGAKSYDIGLRSAVAGDAHGHAAAAMGPAGAKAAAVAPASGSVAVEIKMYAFAPSALTIPVGTTVTWTNEDSAPHTVTVSKGPQKFSSPNLQKGDTFSFTFTQPGTYSYFCAVHPDMMATVTVTGGSSTSVPPTSTGTSDPAPSTSMSMPAPSGDGACEVSTAMQAFVNHLNSGHLSESPEQQVQDLANFDQYVKTHTVLIENMLAPMTTGGGLSNLLTSPLQTFFAHVNSGHLSESPEQQVKDLTDFNQYVKTHTVLIENMIKPLEDQAC